jgi:hypothetical protein
VRYLIIRAIGSFLSILLVGVAIRVLGRGLRQRC